MWRAARDERRVPRHSLLTPTIVRADSIGSATTAGSRTVNVEPWP